MTREKRESLISQIRIISTDLVSAPDGDALLVHLDRLPPTMAELSSSLKDRSLCGPERSRVQEATREALLQLQRTLISVESRLQHGQQSVLCELNELVVQQEWAERSRQIT